MLTPLQAFCFCWMSLFGVIHAEGTGGEKVVVREGDDAILPCSLSTKEDIKVFDWTKAAQKDEREVFMYNAGFHYNNGREGQSERFKGRVSHFEEELKHGNASIIIRNTKMADRGNYTCVFPNLQPQRQTFQIQLIVEPTMKNRWGENKAATPKPQATILNATDHWALLQCEVSGASPEPSVEWRNSSGHRLPAEQPQVSERGGRYDVILQTTVTKTDNYRCVVTQETIYHQISAQTFVYISEKVCEDCSYKVSIGWLFVTLVLGALIVLALLKAPEFIKEQQNKRKENDPSDDGTKMSLKNGASPSQPC